MQAAAESAQWARLDRLFGRYLRGEVATYVGTLSASDNESVLDGAGNGAFSDKRIPLADAISALSINSSQALLSVFSPSTTQYVQLQQSQDSPGVTRSSMILGFNMGGGPTATCTGCAPDFFARPAKLEWDSLAATFVDASLSEPFHVVSSLESQLESPCDLTWDQFALLDTLEIDDSGASGLSGFARVGSEMVEHIAGQIQTVAPEPRSCIGKRVSYTIDAFVNLSDLSQYGLQNYALGTETDICTP